MTAPQRIRLSRAKGFRLPAGTVSVARPGRWGNPFVVGRHGTRAQVVWRYVHLANGFINLGISDPSPDLQMLVHAQIRDRLHDLKGKDLACWCGHDGPCHGDVLLHLANGGKITGLNHLSVELPTTGIGILAADMRASMISKQLGEQKA